MAINKGKVRLNVGLNEKSVSDLKNRIKNETQKFSKNNKIDLDFGMASASTLTDILSGASTEITKMNKGLGITETITKTINSEGQTLANNIKISTNYDKQKKAQLKAIRKEYQTQLSMINAITNAQLKVNDIEQSIRRTRAKGDKDLDTERGLIEQKKLYKEINDSLSREYKLKAKVAKMDKETSKSTIDLLNSQIRSEEHLQKIAKGNIVTNRLTDMRKEEELLSKQLKLQRDYNIAKSEVADANALKQKQDIYKNIVDSLIRENKLKEQLLKATKSEKVEVQKILQAQMKVEQKYQSKMRGNLSDSKLTDKKEEVKLLKTKVDLENKLNLLEADTADVSKLSKRNDLYKQINNSISKEYKLKAQLLTATEKQARATEIELEKQIAREQTTQKSIRAEISRDRLDSLSEEARLVENTADAQRKYNLEMSKITDTSSLQEQSQLYQDINNSLNREYKLKTQLIQAERNEAKETQTVLGLQIQQEQSMRKQLQQRGMSKGLKSIKEETLLTKKMIQLERDLAIAKAKSNDARKESQGIIGMLKSGFKGMGKSILMSVASLASLYAVLRQIGNAIKYIMELDNQLTQIAMVTGKTREEVGKLAESYRDMGQALRQSTLALTESAQGFYRQGLASGEVNKRLKATAKLSKVLGEEMPLMAEKLTAGMNSMGVSAEHLSDVVVKVGASAGTSGNEMLTVIQLAGSTAKATGTSLEELASIAGTISESTRLSAETIGTAMNTIMAKLNQVNSKTDDYGKVVKAIEATGVQAYDRQTGAVRGLSDILQDLGKVYDRLTPKKKLALSSAFGVRQLNKVMVAMQSTKRQAEILDGAMNAQGETDKQYGVYLESLDAILADFKNSVEDLYRALVDEDAIKFVLTSLTSIIDGLTELVKGLKSVIKNAKFTIPLMLALAVAVKSIEVGSLAQGLSLMGASLLPKLTTAIGVTTTALEGFAMSTGGIVIAIGAVTMAFSKAIDSHREFKEGATETAQIIAEGTLEDVQNALAELQQVQDAGYVPKYVYQGGGFSDPESVERMNKANAILQKRGMVIEDLGDITKQLKDRESELINEAIRNGQAMGELSEKEQELLDAKNKKLYDLNIALEQNQIEYDGVTNSLSSLTSAYASLNSGEEISYQSILNLLDKYPELVDYINLTGDVTFKKGEMLKKVAKFEKLAVENSIKNEIRLLKAKKVVLQQSLDDEVAFYEKSLSIAMPFYKTMIKLAQGSKDPSSLTSNKTTPEIEALDESISVLEAKLKAIEGIDISTQFDRELSKKAKSVKKYLSLLKEIADEEYNISIISAKSAMNDNLMNQIDNTERYTQAMVESITTRMGYRQEEIEQQKKLQESLHKLNEARRADLSSMKENSEEYNKLQKDIQGASEKWFSAQQRIESLMQENDNEIKQLKMDIKDIDNQLSDIIKAHYAEKFTQSLKKVQTPFESISNHLETINAQISLLSKIDDFNNAIALSGERLSINKTAVTELKREYDKLSDMKSKATDSEQENELADAMANISSQIRDAELNSISFKTELGKLSLQKMSNSMNDITSQLQSQIQLIDSQLNPLMEGFLDSFADILPENELSDVSIELDDYANNIKDIYDDEENRLREIRELRHEANEDEVSERKDAYEKSMSDLIKHRANLQEQLELAYGVEEDLASEHHDTMLELLENFGENGEEILKLLAEQSETVKDKVGDIIDSLKDEVDNVGDESETTSGGNWQEEVSGSEFQSKSNILDEYIKLEQGYVVNALDATLEKEMFKLRKELEDRYKVLEGGYFAGGLSDAELSEMKRIKKVFNYNEGGITTNNQLAIVGDKNGKDGQELLVYPNGKMELSDNQAQLKQLPKGTQIVPADLTKELLANDKFASNVMPNYASGSYDTRKLTSWLDNHQGSNLGKELMDMVKGLSHAEGIKVLQNTFGYSGQYDNGLIGGRFERHNVNSPLLGELVNVGRYLVGFKKKVDSGEISSYPTYTGGSSSSSGSYNGGATTKPSMPSFDTGKVEYNGSHPLDGGNHETSNVAKIDFEAISNLNKAYASQLELKRAINDVRKSDLTDEEKLMAIQKLSNTTGIELLKDKIKVQEDLIERQDEYLADLYDEYQQNKDNPELAKQIKDDYDKVYKARINAVTTLRNATKQLYKTMIDGQNISINNIQNEIDMTQTRIKYNDTYKQSLANTIEYQKLISLQQQKASQISESIGNLETQQNKVDVGSLEWNLLEEQLDKFRKNEYEAMVTLDSFKQQFYQGELDQIDETVDKNRSSLELYRKQMELLTAQQGDIAKPSGDMLRTQKEYIISIKTALSDLEKLKNTTTANSNEWDLVNDKLTEYKGKLIDAQKEMLDMNKSIQKNLLEMYSADSSKLIDAYKRQVEIIKDEIEDLNDSRDKEVDIKNELIDTYNDEIDKIQKVNEEEEKRVALKEKQDALEKAKLERDKISKEKTVKVFKDGKFELQVNQEELKKAQEQVEKAQSNLDKFNKNEAINSEMEKYRDKIQELKQDIQDINENYKLKIDIKKGEIDKIEDLTDNIKDESKALKELAESGKLSNDVLMKLVSVQRNNLQKTFTDVSNSIRQQGHTLNSYTIKMNELIKKANQLGGNISNYDSMLNKSYNSQSNQNTYNNDSTIVNIGNVNTRTNFGETVQQIKQISKIR